MAKAIQVVVLPQGASAEAVAAQTTLINAISSAVEQTGLDVAEVLDVVNGLEPATIEEVSAAIAKALEELPVAATEAQVKAAITEAINGVKADIANVSGQVEDLANSKGCSKKSAMFFEFLAAGCLLVFLLRRKH